MSRVRHKWMALYLSLGSFSFVLRDVRSTSRLTIEDSHNDLHTNGWHSMAFTLSERRARLCAIETEYARKKAINHLHRSHASDDAGTDVFSAIAAQFGASAVEETRRALAQYRGARPWPRKILARLAVAVQDERDAITRLESRLGTLPHQAQVNGNGWILTDDVERGLTVLHIEQRRLTRKMRYALRGAGFTRSTDVGWCRERSEAARTAGLAVGKMIEEGRGELLPDHGADPTREEG